MITAWMIVNSALKQPKFTAHDTFVTEAAAKCGVKLEVIGNTDALPKLDEPDISFPQFVLMMDKDVALAKQLENFRFRVFNSAHAIETCDNKIKTYFALSMQEVHFPWTIVAPFCYEGSKQEPKFFYWAADILGYPLVIKEAYGSFGEQVYLIKNELELLKKVVELGSHPFLLQEYVATSHGHDIRLQVIGNEVVAAMERKSATDFRANATLGGQLSPYTPTKEEKELAIKAAKICGCDFAGVDLLFGKEGPLICEVNSNAHLLNLHQTTGINAAERMIQYILSTIMKDEEPLC